MTGPSSPSQSGFTEWGITTSANGALKPAFLKKRLGFSGAVRFVALM